MRYNRGIMSSTSRKPTYPSEPWSQTAKGLFKGIWKIVAWVGGFIVIAAVALSGYQWLEENGTITHDQTIDVYMSSNWMVGENRTCSLNLQVDANGKPTRKLDNLQCPVGFEKVEPHNLTVTFKGVIDPVDINGNQRPVADQWKCTRGSDRFSCVPEAYPAKAPNP